MKFILLSFKNIAKFMKNHPVMFVFLICVQIVCMVVIFITCGMAYNMNYVEEEDKFKTNDKEFAFGFTNDDKYTTAIDLETGERLIYDESGKLTDKKEYPDVITVGEMRGLLNEFLDRVSEYKVLGGQLDVITGKVVTKEDYALEFLTYIPDIDYEEGTKDDNVLQYVSSDEKVLFGGVDLENGPSEWFPFVPGEEYEFYGKKYKCMGDYGWLFIPFKAMPDEFGVTSIRIYFEKYLYEDDVEKINQTANDVFGLKIKHKVIPEPYDPVEFQFTKMLFIISILMIIVVILAIAKFYNFILGERTSTLGVLRLCGCTRTKVHIVYMIEILATMIVTSTIGYLLFKFVVYDWLAQYYKSFRFFFITPVYAVIMGTYLVLALVIMSLSVIPSTKVSVKDMGHKA